MVSELAGSAAPGMKGSSLRAAISTNGVPPRPGDRRRAARLSRSLVRGHSAVGEPAAAPPRRTGRIDEQHIAEPGLVVMDFTAADDEDTVRSVMEVWC
ncbi:DUF6207 family protein [Streptomyces sp. MS1.HAVA.3]|uniref:DUF6207 family protein n=1 Tax=Streptomyces caledonius TaxID=3134107 RepID=A0ABU8U2Q5_9ACTN